MRLEDFLSQGPVIRVLLTSVRGSSPREAGTEMFVGETGLFGTIGGGQLEYMGLDKARAMLRSGETRSDMAGGWLCASPGCTGPTVMPRWSGHGRRPRHAPMST